MTANQFRKLVLGLPEVIEREHMGHPDFRVGGKIFATLGPDEKWGMVSLTADQQAVFMRAEPNIYRPASGAWGRNGATLVAFGKQRSTTIREAVITAWRNRAPKRLARQFDED